MCKDPIASVRTGLPSKPPPVPSEPFGNSVGGQMDPFAYALDEAVVSFGQPDIPNPDSERGKARALLRRPGFKPFPFRVDQQLHLPLRPFNQDNFPEVVIDWHRISMIDSLIGVFQLSLESFFSIDRPDILRPPPRHCSKIIPFRKPDLNKRFDPLCNGSCVAQRIAGSGVDRRHQVKVARRTLVFRVASVRSARSKPAQLTDTSDSFEPTCARA